MRLKAALLGDLRRIMASEIKGASRGVTRAMKEAANGLKQELRKQVVDAGLGRRVANAWRSRVFPGSGESVEAAAFVWSKAPDIHHAFDVGATIRPRRTRGLLVPTDEARKLARNRRPTPEMIARITGRPLVPVRTRRGTLVLVATLRVRGGKRGGFAAIRSARTRSAVASVVMFVFARRVKLGKRLDVAGAAARWRDRVPDLVLRHYPEEPR